MKVPDKKKCIKLLRENHAPVHIIKHCVKVAAVSLFIGDRLQKKGIDINTDLLMAGALLHDISKYQSIVSGGDHAVMGAVLLETLGYPEVARIVKCHVHLDRQINKGERIDEVLVVNYGDKRVKHTDVVSLNERFDDLMLRYGTNSRRQTRISELFEQSKKMEDLIFSIIDLDPDSLNRMFRRKD